MSGGWEEHPKGYTCPRCGSGAGDDFCLPLTNKHPHATLLRMHPERGATPHQLQRNGYVQYEATVEGEPMTLWHKPGTIQCTRGAAEANPNLERA